MLTISPPCYTLSLALFLANTPSPFLRCCKQGTTTFEMHCHPSSNVALRTPLPYHYHIFLQTIILKITATKLSFPDCYPSYHHHRWHHYTEIMHNPHINPPFFQLAFIFYLLIGKWHSLFLGDIFYPVLFSHDIVFKGEFEDLDCLLLMNIYYCFSYFWKTTARMKKENLAFLFSSFHTFLIPPCLELCPNLFLHRDSERVRIG